jgi:hypothetical protein
VTAMAVDRRLVLAGALGALGALAPMRRAAAFQIEPASPDVTALMNARCEAASVHEQLVRDLLVRFAALGEEEARAQVRAMACPICGCGLAGAVQAVASPTPPASPPPTPMGGP